MKFSNYGGINQDHFLLKRFNLVLEVFKKQDVSLKFSFKPNSHHCHHHK